MGTQSPLRSYDPGSARLLHGGGSVGRVTTGSRFRAQLIRMPALTVP